MITKVNSTAEYLNEKAEKEQLNLYKAISKGVLLKFRKSSSELENAAIGTLFLQTIQNTDRNGYGMYSP